MCFPRYTAQTTSPESFPTATERHINFETSEVILIILSILNNFLIVNQLCYWLRGCC